MKTLFDWPDASEAERPPWTVTELTRRIKGALESGFPSVYLEGEISNLSQPASGHLYFTLKDEAAQMGAVIWRSDLVRMACTPREGMRVRVRGRVTVYEKRGSYQLTVSTLEEAGEGALFQQFEKLKRKLEAEGLFEGARKRPIPLLSRHIGVVTSPTGAAIQDILKVLCRRFPNVHVLIAPARVQGVGAAAEIAAAIDELNARGGLEVLIIGRGGGSLEELWCFNEEIVARAIARSKIPVISAVGHETDFTISDFVADLRAPTPSAAAELVVGRKEDFVANLDQDRRRLEAGIRIRFEHYRRRVEICRRGSVFKEPAHLIRVLRERLGRHRQVLGHALESAWRERQQRVDEWSQRTQRALQDRRISARRDLDRLTVQLRVLNPLNVLERGYSLTQRTDGRVVRNAAEVEPGETLHTRLARGSIEVEVKRHEST
jgi:exodeoxyribonuclease VII large subunit